MKDNREFLDGMWKIAARLHSKAPRRIFLYLSRRGICSPHGQGQPVQVPCCGNPPGRQPAGEGTIPWCQYCGRTNQSP